MSDFGKGFFDTDPKSKEEYRAEIERLTAELAEARRLMARLGRGCDCEHDYRCYRCDAVIEAKEFATREGE